MTKKLFDLLKGPGSYKVICKWYISLYLNFRVYYISKSAFVAQEKHIFSQNHNVVFKIDENTYQKCIKCIKCIISLNLISTEAIIYSILELRRNDIFLTFKSRCIGNSSTHISKTLFEYCSIVNRLHFKKKVFLQVRLISGK